MQKDELARLKERTAGLKEDIEQVKADRVSQGLPADRPPKFVPFAMGWALFQSCEPLINYAVRYASLCDKSNEVIEISDEHMEWIRQFEYEVILLQNVAGNMSTIHRAMDGIYSRLVGHAKYETASELVRDLAFFIKHTRHEYGEYTVDMLVYDALVDKEENIRIKKVVSAEVERQQDEEVYKGEYEALVEHYRSIEHLY